MLYRGRWAAGLVVFLAWAAAPGRASADAKARVDGARVEKPKDETPRAEARPGERALPLAFEGLRWGMTRRQLEECVDRQIEAESVGARKRALSTPALRDVEAQVAAQKAAFRRSYVELSEGPDGFDTSPLVGEFSKGNGEALMRRPTAEGGRTWFFLIGDRLWKTYEEVPSGADAAHGNALDRELKRGRASFGRAPKLTPAAPAKGRSATLYEWDDDATHVRLWDRGAGFAALVHEERAMLARLPSVRKKVARAPEPDAGLSPQVSAVLRVSEKKPAAPRPKR